MKKCNACEIYPAMEGKDKCESCYGILKHININPLKPKQMGTKKNENVDVIDEITILSKEQIDALPEEAVEKVRSLSGGNLPAKQLQIFVPVVQSYMALRDKALELKAERDEDGEITKESIEAYKSLKADQRSFNGELKREIKKIKDPLNAIKGDVITVEKTFAEESDKIKVAAEEAFKDYEAEVERAKQAALDKKNAAMNAQIDKAKEEAERLQEQSEVSNIYNEIKYTRIQEFITNRVDDAIFENNEDTLASLKAQIAQKTWESLIAGLSIIKLDDDSLKELYETFLKAKERAIFKLDQKFEEYERKRQEYAESKVKEQVPPPPVPGVQSVQQFEENRLSEETDGIQSLEKSNDEDFVKSILTEIIRVRNVVLNRVKRGAPSVEVRQLLNELETLLNNIQ